MKKIEITCKTCGVTESFYSNLSVEHFKASHRGHDLTSGGGEAAQTKTDEIDLVPKARAPLEREGTRLAKVIVDLVVFPALRDSVFRVRGFRDDLDEAFVATSRFENGERVRAMLESGQYEDYGFSGLRYVWEPTAIEYQGDARERLGLPLEEASATTTEPSPEPALEPRERPQDFEESSVAKTNEMLFADLRRVGPDMTDADPVFPPSPQQDESAVAQPSPSPPAAKEQEPEPEPKETPAPPRSPRAKKEKVEVKEEKVEKKVVETTSSEPTAPVRVEEDDSNLLVSKSWYIQGGAGNRQEAARISQVLKAFRWKVEPVYTIGVILDDMLSIETSKSQISKMLINSIEGAGYRLTAVTAEQGKPVAWFKKAASAPDEGGASGPSVSSPEAVVEAESEQEGFVPE